jgi:hypothetical protein
MDTLHARLAELADHAPTGGAPAAELWARGKRAHRLRGVGLAAVLIVALGVVGTGIGVRLVKGDGNRSTLASGRTAGIELPIQYPARTALRNLGDTPGPLVAIWVTPRAGGGALEAVGLVAESGTFGTLPIDVSFGVYDGVVGVALSPGGRMIAYATPPGRLTVRDLVTGASYTPYFGFEIRSGHTWIDDTHLVGHVPGGSDVDGWVWEPGTAPKRVDLRPDPGSPWLGPYGGRDPWFNTQVGSGPCSSPTVHESGDPMLCDVVGVIGSDVVLTHWDSEVVALDRADSPFDDSDVRRVVVAAGAPGRVTFATDLIGEALEADSGAS